MMQSSRQFNNLSVRLGSDAVRLSRCEGCHQLNVRTVKPKDIFMEVKHC